MSAISNIALPYKVRCDLPDCRKPSQQVYRIIVDDFRVTCCSPQHARLGESRWEEKKRLDVRMGVPPKEPVDEQVGDNILDDY